MTMDQVVLQRGRLKGSITRASTYAEGLQDGCTLEQITGRLKLLEESWEAFTALTDNLLQFVDEEGFVDPETDFSEYEEKYLNASATMNSWKSKLSVTPTTQTSPAMEELASQQAAFLKQMALLTPLPHTPVDAILPRINIPVFSGGYKDWTSFQNLFESAIHSKSKSALSDVQKFYHLKSLLAGDAAQLIQHIPVSDKAYSTAWSRLKDRFDRPKYIINEFIETFMSLPSTTVENASTLRSISDQANEVLRGLDAVGNDGRDCWLIFILLSKLDGETKSRWIHETRDTEDPTMADFLAFMDQRCEELELCQLKPTALAKGKVDSTKLRGNPTKCLVSINNSPQCPKCKLNDHFIYKCPHFINLNPNERRNFVKRSALCFNCLRPGHGVNTCSSKGKCRECQKQHHSMLHLPLNGSSHATTSGVIPTLQQQQVMPQMQVSAPEPKTLHLGAQYGQWSTADGAHSTSMTSHVMQPPHNPSKEFCMPTALVHVQNSHGQLVQCRALLDTGSKLSYMTESCAQRLGLPRLPSKIVVNGISSVQAETTRGCCLVTVHSQCGVHSIKSQLHVLSSITSLLPVRSFINKIEHQFSGLQLADPGYNVSSPVDILFGVEHVWDIFTFERKFDNQGNTIALSSIFGWVVTCADLQQSSSKAVSLVASVDVDRCLRQFWEMEEADHVTGLDADDAFVESHFMKTHNRAADGKYVVELPFKTPNPQFGNTLAGAKSRFLAVERRLQKNESLRLQYTKFMRDYEALGHMKLLSKEEIARDDGRVFYLPHHPVIGDKLRVVFDGSFEDSDGVALNSTLHIGPKIQRDLVAVCLRFRLHKFVFSADIVKMFRQIWVSDEHQDYQRVVWRLGPSEPLQHFKLTTVTYGTASAPYLSIRVLNQLAKDYHSEFPWASKVVLEDFYVDDVLTGAPSEAELACLQESLVKLLSYAGLELRKWVSNSSRICDDEQEHALPCGTNDDIKKVLGIFWNPAKDVLGFKVALSDNVLATKRQVLSDVSRLFDPMGLLAPVVVQFKILLREIWTMDLDWDEELPPEILSLWTKYRNDLHNIQGIHLNRLVHCGAETIELHGFSDASIQAYSAAVYARFVDETGVTHTSLLAAKTRVAPIKQQSLPRLELCGALLLSRLLTRVVESLSSHSTTIHAWCDSTIVLSWLSQPPIKLKTFEGNRTSKILDKIPRSAWNHVSSKDNPADCASRGMPASTLQQFQLWWKGPDWLLDPLSVFPSAQTNFDDPDAHSGFKRSAVSMVATVEDYNPIDFLIHRCSRWTKIIRVVAYMIKFKNVTLLKSSKSSGVTFNELQLAKSVLIQHAQHEFATERRELSLQKPLNVRSSILKLNPFLDQQGVLRVGGRICNSLLQSDVQHPIILPKSSRITTLILEDLHMRNLHPGVSALFVIARQQFWIVGARNMIRALTHKCMKCFRQRQLTTSQLMSDLPSVRVRQAFPFENSGCDYAGPFTVKLYKGRNAKKSKAYICLFVCLVTSAIHLELAIDLSTECFLAALRRFISRRGKCRQIYSDNGRNFVGASKELRDMHSTIMTQRRNEILAASLAEDGIEWIYIPPLAPHWGGIWESAVRSVKLHLKRVVANTELTFDQMNTLLTQVEAVVNSRPLGVAPDTDCEYLSPAHFLIGRPYTMVPEGDLVHTNPNRLDYWQHVQNLFQGFWKRWHSEYLTSLQQRPKWNIRQDNLKQDEVVVIKEKNIPPSKWLLARIIATYPGPDGNIRVVRLKTKTGEFTRPITAVVRLPIF